MPKHSLIVHTFDILFSILIVDFLESTILSTNSRLEDIGYRNDLVHVVVVIDCQFAEVQEFLRLLLGPEQVCTACHHTVVQRQMGEVREYLAHELYEYVLKFELLLLL